MAIPKKLRDKYEISNDSSNSPKPKVEVERKETTEVDIEALLGFEDESEEVAQEKHIDIPIKSIVEPESVIEEEKIQEVEEVEEVPVVETIQQNSSASRATTYKRDKLPRSHNARFVQRPDVPIENYSKVGKTTSIYFYDKELHKWLKDFSYNNQDAGGCAIPQGYIIEMMMGILKYDLDINPIGYETREELMNEIKSKLNLK